ncbi:ATP-binding protein [Halalkalibacillus sediminis]|uniref:ATP-binding protein n=1 Tax=Halalkalibacillus sediminis TaxID=2018042 RepID=A0A2I0QQT9_9BACI|nr:diphthine--ammonia ligase [Halalkalibacillus sediminis]PKR76696.1 ATP-binding protein [Halalkalibacillus sediminis]
MKRVMVSFSGGKDSMLALHRLSQEEEVVIDSLLTTVNEAYNRTSIHGVREEILDLQAESLGFPLRKVQLPKQPSNEFYEKEMAQIMQEAEADGVTHVMFGDIFLEDIREYREKNLESTSCEAIFPIWGESTADLMHEFIELGYETIITTIDPKRVPQYFLGKMMTHEFVKALPKDVDPCGEYGEFHTLVVDGPMFSKRIPAALTDEIREEEFYTYVDVTIESKKG